MELRHLRSFVAVAEELHFGRAAARLHISQPPLSQRIRHLEDELGARLFRRTKRRVVLTPAGQAFLPEARQTLAQAERAVRAAQRAERGELGELVVGYLITAAYGPLPDVIRRFRRRFPDVDIRLQNLRSVPQRQALLNRQIDVGFVRPQAPIRVSSMRHSGATRSSLLCLAITPSHAGHTWTSRILSRSRSSSSRPKMRGPSTIRSSRSAREGFTPRVVHRAPDLHAAIALVAAGLGIGPVPAAIQGFKRKGVVYRPLRPHTFGIEMGLAWRRDDDSALVQQFRRVARAVAGRAER